MRRVVSRLAVAASAFVLAGSSATASASEPTDLVDPTRRGSLVDVTSTLVAAESDVGRSDGPPISAGASTNGCSAAMLKPIVNPDPASSTGASVSSRYSFHCVLAAGGSNTFSLEYATADGWKSLKADSVSVPGDGGLAGAPVSAPCRAGTWHYRGRASGTVNFVTASTAVTCVRASDPLYIDPA